MVKEHRDQELSHCRTLQPLKQIYFWFTFKTSTSCGSSNWMSPSNLSELEAHTHELGQPSASEVNPNGQGKAQREVSNLQSVSTGKRFKFNQNLREKLV